MHAELNHFSPNSMKGLRLVLGAGERRSYVDPMVGKRIIVACTDDPEGVVITEEQRTFDEVPNSLFRRVLTLRGSRRVERWEVQESQVLQTGQQRHFYFSEGLGNFGFLTVRAKV